MARYEFGIMQSAPIEGERYDNYEPEKFNCITVDDCYIENIPDLLELKKLCQKAQYENKWMIHFGL